MNISKSSILRPITTLMLTFIVVLLGLVSFTRLPLDLFPKMEIPVAVVVVRYENAAPTEVESLITKPIEQQISTVERLKSVSSISQEGMAIVIAQFEDNTNMNFATLNMREKVGLISEYLPDKSSEPMILAVNPNMAPIMQIYISSDMPLAQLYSIVDKELLSPIERSEGVAAASVFGGIENEISIELNQEKLSAFGLSLPQISQILAAENINLPSGEVQKGSKKLVARTIGQFESVDNLKSLPILLATGELIYLGDISNIQEVAQEPTSIGRISGSTAIGISITKQSTSNTVVVSNNVNSALKELRVKYPDLDFTIAFDQAKYVKNSIFNLAESALLGCLLSIAIIFFFLRNIASTLIIAISIPTSFIATFMLMYFGGLTMNILSLGGLAVAVGMLVDDSIVVLENIYRLKEDGYSSIDASIDGANQVKMPVFAATMTKIAVFLPMVFVTGITATLFREFSLTIGFALACSLVVSLTVVPMLCSKFLGRQIRVAKVSKVTSAMSKFSLLPGFTKGINLLIEKYVILIKYALSHRKKVMVISISLLLVSGALILFVGGELFPTSDESSYTISVETPFGTSLEETDQIMSQIESYVINETPELVSCALSIGNTSVFSLGSQNQSTITVNVVEKNKRKLSIKEIVDRTRKDLNSIAGAKISIAEANMTSMMTGSSSPIQIMVKGDDLTTLRTIADTYVRLIENIDGIKEVKSDVVEGNPEVKVIIDRSKAAFYGITSYQLANALESGLAGTNPTTLKKNGEEIQISVSLSSSYGSSVENMKQILVPNPRNQQVTVGDLASFEYDNSPSQINREDQVRTISVSGNISGRDLKSVSNDVVKALDTYILPDNYSYTTGGQQKEMVDAFTSLAYALLLSLILVYMILASQFESLVQPLIIMISIPFALTGAFIGLFVTGTPLSLVGFLGIIMLGGIVVNNSILLVDFINQNLKSGADLNTAIVNAGRYRIRPIIMTMLTTSLALVPIALGFGTGGEIQAGMGITVIFGLLFSTFITLIIVPVIYSYVEGLKIMIKSRRRISNGEKI
jgi:hydrophobic/amphiphilic exporter-1 (mainly G- bacteria), HAE1 family